MGRKKAYGLVSGLLIVASLFSGCEAGPTVPSSALTASEPMPSERSSDGSATVRDGVSAEQEAMEILVEDDPSTDLIYRMGQGMRMMGTGDTVYLSGETCTVIAVGTGHEQSFVREELFGVGASGAIYTYDVPNDQWVPSNRLAEIYQNSTDERNLFAVICEPNGHEESDFYSHGRTEKVTISDPLLYSDTPMLLLPMKNDVKIKVEWLTFTPEGNVASEQVLEETMLSRGDLCWIYAKYMQDTSPLLLVAEWEDDAGREYNVCWWAVGGGGEYGENYLEYVAGQGGDTPGSDTLRLG